MDVLPETPSPLETSHTFFDSAEAPKALFIVQVLRLSAVYKRIKVHLGQAWGKPGPDNANILLI